MFRFSAGIARQFGRRSLRAALAIGSLVLLSGTAPSTSEARVGPEPVSFTESLPRSFDTVVMPFVDEATFLQEDADRIARGIDGPYRFAAPLSTRLTPSTDGTWNDLPDGSRLWRLKVVSIAARTLNFGFTTYRLPAGASVYVYPEDQTEYDGPYTAADATPEAQFWTAVIRGDAAVIELHVPAHPAFEPELVIGQVSHDYRGFGELAATMAKSGSCNNDVVCPEGDPWRDEINSEGVFTLSGSWTCSGQMINTNTARSSAPVFPHRLSLRDRCVQLREHRRLLEFPVSHVRPARRRLALPAPVRLHVPGQVVHVRLLHRPAQPGSDRCLARLLRRLERRRSERAHAQHLHPPPELR